jgi:glycerate kinase
MSFRVLIVPDKFKGTLSAKNAAFAIARGWKKFRPNDALDILPMSDGGDGFGEIISELLGAKPRKIKTVDAAHQRIETRWWWNAKTKMAVVESAKIIGLAMLPPKKFHPFQLDTYGLGNVLLAAEKLGCRHCIVGIGGSATNDGGFGMARALGWKFFSADKSEITAWTDLILLKQIVPPRRLKMKVTVAVDVENPLLGKSGATRIYGPQKGLRPADFAIAEKSLKQLAVVSKKLFGKDFAKISGAGAAGGLGFGFMTFANAKKESGFEIFATSANLEKRLRNTDVVLTGEGAMDRQTLMGKGVGQIALRCKRLKIPCVGLAGMIFEPKKMKTLFAEARCLTEIASIEKAKMQPEKYLAKLSEEIARNYFR